MTDKEFADYWAFLVEKKFSTKAALSSDERAFYAANIFRGSIPRSGLIGYFENTECDVIRDAHDALAMLDLTDALKLLQDAQKTVLNGAPLPETDQCLTLFDDNLSEEELELAMDELDKRVGDIQNELYLQDQAIFDSLCRFADERSLHVPTG
jgi:hypothetical protein